MSTSPISSQKRFPSDRNSPEPLNLVIPDRAQVQKQLQEAPSNWQQKAGKVLIAIGVVAAIAAIACGIVFLTVATGGGALALTALIAGCSGFGVGLIGMGIHRQGDLAALQSAEIAVVARMNVEQQQKERPSLFGLTGPDDKGFSATGSSLSSAISPSQNNSPIPLSRVNTQNLSEPGTGSNTPVRTGLGTGSFSSTQTSDVNEHLTEAAESSEEIQNMLNWRQTEVVEVDRIFAKNSLQSGKLELLQLIHCLNGDGQQGLKEAILAGLESFAGDKQALVNTLITKFTRYLERTYEADRKLPGKKDTYALWIQGGLRKQFSAAKEQRESLNGQMDWTVIQVIVSLAKHGQDGLDKSDIITEIMSRRSVNAMQLDSEIYRLCNLSNEDLKKILAITQKCSDPQDIDHLISKRDVLYRIFQQCPLADMGGLVKFQLDNLQVLEGALKLCDTIEKKQDLVKHYVSVPAGSTAARGLGLWAFVNTVFPNNVDVRIALLPVLAKLPRNVWFYCENERFTSLTPELQLHLLTLLRTCDQTQVVDILSLVSSPSDMKAAKIVIELLACSSEGLVAKIVELKNTTKTPLSALPKTEVAGGSVQATTKTTLPIPTNIGAVMRNVGVKPPVNNKM